MTQRHHLPWNVSNHYWIAVKASASIKEVLSHAGYLLHRDGYHLLHVGGSWKKEWQRLNTILKNTPSGDATLIAVVPLETQPTLADIDPHWRSPREIQHIADSLWLGEALLEDRITCYLQPIVDKDRNIFGYEAFARIEQSDKIVNGFSIVEASRALNIEYKLDRHLHHKAIEAFAQGGYEGHLFINFFSGFIHRPEVYLDNLKKETKRYSISPKQIVLDIIQPESQTNLSHLKAIGEYCHSEGYSIALDDMTSPRNAERLIHSLNPNFIKIDHALTADLSSAETLSLIQQSVKLAHLKKIQVIGERIESEATFQILKNANVDLFQGYYTGEPFPVRAAQSKAKSSK